MDRTQLHGVPGPPDQRLHNETVVTARPSPKALLDGYETSVSITNGAVFKRNMVSVVSRMDRLYY